ncbi:MAG TPA: hypothetical protein VHI72_10900 [Hyphomicrobiaceae bacterium]|nr:hypothetical protein [Hyphomicrobiaceae bacterium]
MSQTTSPPYQPPQIDVRGLQERKLQEAELFGLERQLHHFGRIGDRLSAVDIDSAAHYRKLLMRRDEIAATMKTPTPVPVAPPASAGSPYQRRAPTSWWTKTSDGR